MHENPYEAPKISEKAEARPRSALVRIVRRVLTLLIVTVSGIAGIIGGAAALSLVMPQARESDYFIGLLAVSTMVGGITAAVLATIILKKLLELIGL
jgi:hypothetical protein